MSILVPDCKDCVNFTLAPKYARMQDKVANAQCAAFTYKSCVCGTRSRYTVGAARSRENLCGLEGKSFKLKVVSTPPQ